MSGILLDFIQSIAVAAGTALAGMLIVWLKNKIGVAGMQKIAEQSALIKQIVEAGVQYAEQAFHAGEKLEKSVEWIVQTLNAKGIKVTEQEIKGLVEATLREFKDKFGEDWANATSKKDLPEGVSALEIKK